EVVLLVIERIVGNVHLPVYAEQRPIRIHYHGGVVVEAGRPLLENRNDEDDLELAGELPEPLGGGAGDRLREVESLGLGYLAEVGCVEELLQADDLSAAPSRLANRLLVRRDRLFLPLAHGELHQPDLEGFCRHLTRYG